MRAERESCLVQPPKRIAYSQAAGSTRQLRPSDPYMHFRTPTSCCFEKLFDADEIARFEREIGGENQEAVGWDEMVGGGVGGWW